MLGNRCSLTLSAAVVVTLLGLGGAAHGEIFLSTNNTATLAGLTFRDGDVVMYDPLAEVATLLFSQDVFLSRKTDIDALHVLENGHLILSTLKDAELPGLKFRDGDLVEYDPVAGTATLVFSEDLFGNNEDIDAAYLFENGHILLSTTNNAKLGGLEFRDNDLVEYDPVSGTATVFFSHNLFRRKSDIDAAHVLSNGHVVLSTQGNATLDGLRFRDGDLVEYNPVTGVATLLFQESLFSRNEDINAASIIEPVAPPEPGTLLLLLGGAAVAVLRHRRRSA